MRQGLVAVVLCVGLCGLARVEGGVLRVAVSRVCVMSGFLVSSLFMMISGFVVMPRRVLVVLGSFTMML